MSGREAVIAEAKKRLGRAASVLEVGGFRPPDVLTGSWFGTVKLGAPGESWPVWRDTPLRPLCQLNIDELTVEKPATLRDIALLTFYIAEDWQDGDFPELVDPGEGLGATWCLRAYSDVKALAPVNVPAEWADTKSFPARWTAPVIEYPSHDLLPFEPTDWLPEWLRDTYYELDFEPSPMGTAVGGWPICIQSEQWWDYRDGGRSFEYAFRIDSEAKAGWNWLDCGAATLARDRENPNRWGFDVQFH